MYSNTNMNLLFCGMKGRKPEMFITQLARYTSELSRSLRTGWGLLDLDCEKFNSSEVGLAVVVS